MCERLLEEKDNVFSAIRIADLYRVPVTDKHPLEKQIIQSSALFIAKLNDIDGVEYDVSFTVTDPNGKIDPLPSQKMALTSVGGLPIDVPRGIVMHIQLGFQPQAGTYYMEAFLNGIPVAKATFTVLLLKQQS